MHGLKIAHNMYLAILLSDLQRIWWHKFLNLIGTFAFAGKFYKSNLKLQFLTTGERS